MRVLNRTERSHRETGGTIMTYSDLGVRDAISSLTADERRMMAALNIGIADGVDTRAADAREAIAREAEDLDELQSLRRKYTADYLKAREDHEDDPADVEAWNRRQTWADVMARVLVATGDYQTAEEARAAVQALTFPQGAERFVELWMSREDLWGALSWSLSVEMVCAVADSVRDWVADGGELGQAPMREWTAPYLVERAA